MSERFVFEPDERAPAVLGVISAARRRLILSLFRCDDFEILDALAAALERGVEVSVLLTPRAKGWTKRLKELWRVLEGMGAKLWRYADPVVKYHAKYIVADRAQALVASLNFTRKCFTSTCDFLLVTDDRGVVDGLGRLFERDCAGSEAPLPRLGDRLIVAPERARTALTAALSGARRSIRVVDPRLTDPAVLDLLKAKRDAGVEVTVLGREGLLRGRAPHGKMILLDGSTGILGSLSLSALSLDFRREVAVVVRDRQCLREMNEVFEGLAGPRPGGGALI